MLMTKELFLLLIKFFNGGNMTLNEFQAIELDSVRKAIIKECDFVIDKRQQKRRKNRQEKRNRKFTKWYATEGKLLVK